MSEFEFNIPVPPRKSGVTASDRLGLIDFPIGASKLIMTDSRTALINQAKYKNKGAKFVTRAVMKDGVKGFRIWRVS